MAEYICIINQDSVIIKPPKKYPLLFGVVVLILSMICGVYICSVCLNLMNSQTETLRVIERPCLDCGIKSLENHHLHFPNPNSFSRDECAGNPVRFFAIVSVQRSGSGWFESLLNSHINVSSNGEIFSHWYRRENITTIVANLDKVYNLDWLSSASKNHCSAAVGFKWMLNQGLMDNHKEVVEYFNRRSVSTIFLFRRNLLRRMVSDLANSYDRYAKLLNGTHKAHVHSAEEAERLSSYKPTIDSTSLIANLEQMESTVTRALSYFNTTRHIVLYYEDIMTNHTKLNEVQEFLGLPKMELESHQVKIHNGSLADHITNWDDVNRTLKGTAYEHFLYADY